MKISDILDQFTATVIRWAVPVNGRVIQAEDPKQAMDLLSSSSGGVVAAVFWAGDRLAGEDFSENTLCEGDIAVGLFRAPGLAKSGSLPALLDLTESLRAALAGMVLFGLMDESPEYSGMRYLATEEGRLLHGYELKFIVRYTRTK